MKTYNFHVTGSGQFPIDMLRYDACFPAAEADSTILSERGRRTVMLTHIDTGRWQPTVGRWESFGWHVTSDVVRVA